MEASTKIVCRIKGKTASGLHPVKLRVTHNRKQKYYSILNYLTKNEWNTIKDQNELESVLMATKGHKKDIRLNYESIENLAQKIINELPIFSFDAFEQHFTNKARDWDYVCNAFEDHTTYLRENDRIGYAISFNSTLTGIKYFCENKRYSKGVKPKKHAHFKKFKSLKFADITYRWLEKYEHFLRKYDKSTSTIGIHTRNIRVLFNLATKEHSVRAEYPFDKYKPGTSDNNKRALDIEQISAIVNYRCMEGSTAQFSRDIFLFSFFANGMNLTDIFRLKFSSIKGDEIEFVRFKTKAKKKEVKVRVTITDTLKQIMQKHKNTSIHQDAYIFPVLNGTNNETERYNRIRQRTKTTNHHLKKIALQLGFERELADHISSYYARHSFATISKNSGVSVAFIMESLGHANMATTEKYLGSFSEDSRKQAALDLEDKIKMAN